MTAKEQLEFYKNQIKSNPELENALWNCEFVFDENVDVEKEILICGEKSNYSIYPFGKDSCGSNYVILDNKFVGFISSEGGCGIIADNINDFFNFLAICKNLQSYFYRGVFDNIESFNKKVKEVNDEDVSPEEHTIFEKFIKDNNFITDTNILYKKLKAALITEPAFILQANPDEYSQWDDVFYTEQEYIKKKKKNR